jgi:hypothetical protein
VPFRVPSGSHLSEVAAELLRREGEVRLMNDSHGVSFSRDNLASFHGAGKRPRGFEVRITTPEQLSTLRRCRCGRPYPEQVTAVGRPPKPAGSVTPIADPER